MTPDPRAVLVALLAAAIGCGPGTVAAAGSTGPTGSSGTSERPPAMAGDGTTGGGPTGDETVGDSGGTGSPSCPGDGPWPGSVDAPWLVSRDPGTSPGTGDTPVVSLSSDGRMVAFSWHGPDESGPLEVRVYDAACDTTLRVPDPGDHSDQGGPAISADGSTVAFVTSLDETQWQIYAYDLEESSLQLISSTADGSPGPGMSTFPAVSHDGRFVAFVSNAPLVAADTDQYADIYLRDRQTSGIELISVADDGTPADSDCGAPSVSADGRFVAFQSHAGNLAMELNPADQVYVRDREQGTTELVSVTSGGPAGAPSKWPSISADGRFVAFESEAEQFVAGDTNGVSDVFVRDLQSSTTERVSVSANGGQVHAGAFAAHISGDGRLVAFLVSGTTDSGNQSRLFVRDRVAGTTTALGIDAGGAPANGDVLLPAISPDGRWVAFKSDATNLATGDDQGDARIYAVATP